MSRIWYFVAALIGMGMHSSGLVLQKKGMDRLDLKQLRKFRITRDFVIWFIGIMLAYVISVLPTGYASKELSPQIVSSISGLSIVLVIVLSHFFLKESIYFSDIVFSGIIILSIFGISVSRDLTSGSRMDSSALYLLILAPFLLLMPVLGKKTDNQTKTVLLSAFSGLTSGLSFVLLNIAVKRAGGSFAGIFNTIYTYEYSIVGFFSGFSMQAAYRFGNIINIAPVQVSLSVIFPLICSYFVFHKHISFVQDLLILVVGFCCWAILRRH
jgi:drug/metabolite transporter (DMT)-like permease